MSREIIRAGTRVATHQQSLVARVLEALINARGLGALLPRRGLSSKAIRLMLCICLACIATASWVQTQQTQGELSKQRLLLLATQDLILQSHALHYVADNRPSLSQLFLEHRGYASAPDLLDQLGLRLRLLQTVQAPESVQHWLQGLQNKWDLLNQLLKTPPQALTKDQALSIRAAIDEWFTQLYGLNRSTQADQKAINQKYALLQEQNNLLSTLMIGLALLMVLSIWWPHSQIGQRVRETLHQIKTQSQIDPLTGILNKMGWMYELTEAIKTVQTQQTVHLGCMVMISIDYFRQYIETFGAEAANLRLRAFADTLRFSCRPQDLIARLSGEEFALFLPKCSLAQTQDIVDRIRHNIHNTAFSAGIVTVDATNPSFQHIMAAADQALYQAQQNGRNQSFSAAA